MAPQPVTMRRRAHDGTTREWQEAGGAVFYPLPEHGVMTPAWVYGPKDAQRMFFTCPVSAIGEDVMDLFRLWNACRITKALPVDGGFLDQPLPVQFAWPIFEDELMVLQRART